MLIYTNPNLGNYALASLLEYAPFYGQPYAAHDLGLRYSQVVSHPDQNRTPVDGALCISCLMKSNSNDLDSFGEYDYYDGCVYEIYG
jgi:hypothetical protein